MSRNSIDLRTIEAAAANYIDAYRQELVTSMMRSEDPKTLTIEDFVKRLPQGSPFQKLLTKEGVHPEILFRDHVELRNFSERDRITFTEGLEKSCVELNKKLDTVARELQDADLLRKEFTAILEDTALSDYEKVMLIVLAKTRGLKIDDALKAGQTLAPFLGGHTFTKSASADYVIDRIAPDIIQRHPLILQSLLYSRLNALVKRQGFFTSQDDRIDYFLGLVNLAEERISAFEASNPGGTMHKIYSGVKDLFEELATLDVPGLRNRIRNPELKIDGIEYALDILENNDRTYKKKELEHILGGASLAAIPALADHTHHTIDVAKNAGKPNCEPRLSAKDGCKVYGSGAVTWIELLFEYNGLITADCR